jgi:hypothetical protein
MASLTLTGLGGRYPDGTTVKAYLVSGLGGLGQQAGGVVTGTPKATAVVASKEVTLSGLTPGAAYWVIGTVAGKELWTWGRVPLAPERPTETETVHGKDLDRFALDGTAVLKEELPWLDLYDYGYDPLATDNEVAINAAIDALPDGSSGKQGGILFPGPAIKCSGEVVGLDHCQGVHWMGRAAPTDWPDAGSESQLRFLQANADTGRAVDVRSSKGFHVEKMMVTNENDGFLGKIFDFEWFNTSSDQDSSGMVFRDVYIGGRGEKGSGLGGYARCGISLKRAILGTFDNVQFQWMVAGVRGQEQESSSIRYSNAHRFDGCTWARLNTGIVNPGEDWALYDPRVEGFANGDGSTPALSFDSFVLIDHTVQSFNGIKIYGGWWGDSFTCDYWFQPGAFGCWRSIFVDGLQCGAGKMLKQVNAGNSKLIVFRNSGMGSVAATTGATDHLVDCGTGGIENLTIENCNLEGGGSSNVPIKNLQRRSSLKGNLYALASLNQDFVQPGALQRGSGRQATGAIQGTGVSSGTLQTESTDMAGRFFFITNGTPATGAQYRVTFAQPYKGSAGVAHPIAIIQAESADTAAAAAKVFVPALSKDYFEVHMNPAPVASKTHAYSYIVVG